MTEVFLGLGSNIGDRKNFLSEAIRMIKAEAGEMVLCSSLWETEPWGFKTDSSFLNMVISIYTSFTPEELLAVIHSMEKKLGRQRSGKEYQSRTIDIDILYFGKQIINLPDIKVPHPGIPKRKFVLVPLNEIAPELCHPANNMTVSEMLKQCKDESGIKLFGVLE